MKMKIIFFALFALITAFSVNAQYTVTTNGSLADADLAVCIKTSIANANLSVKIGENLYNRDISIGLTDNRAEADVILSDNVQASDLLMVKSRLSEADLSVSYGESTINPDIAIEMVSTGTVDYLVFNESASMDIESLIMALLPIINAHIGYKYDVIPSWGDGKENSAATEQEEVELVPTYYAGINLAHWITSIEDGMIQLDDNSIFYVYDDDRYISNLWQKMNDVVVSPTGVEGHYYITKDGGIYKESEVLRAICIKGLQD
jgi:hypothetical protein